MNKRTFVSAFSTVALTVAVGCTNTSQQSGSGGTTQSPLKTDGSHPASADANGNSQTLGGVQNGQKTTTTPAGGTTTPVVNTTTTPAATTTTTTPAATTTPAVSAPVTPVTGNTSSTDAYNKQYGLYVDPDPTALQDMSIFFFQAPPHNAVAAIVATDGTKTLFVDANGNPKPVAPGHRGQLTKWDNYSDGTNVNFNFLLDNGTVCTMANPVNDADFQAQGWKAAINLNGNTCSWVQNAGGGGGGPGGNPGNGGAPGATNPSGAR